MLHEALLLDNLVFRHIGDNILVPMQRGLPWLIIPTQHWGRIHR